MKTYYTTFIISLITLLCTAQEGYEFGIVHNGGYNFKVVAIPDFDSAGNTDLSDFGFSLMLPAGNADVTNISSILGGKTPILNEVDVLALNTLTLGDGTRDLFFLVLSNVPSAIFSHTNGQQFDLLSFEVSNMPVSGVISILPNSDPIAIGLGMSVDSFYNSNIDATTTQDYFSGIASGMESFDFSTLGVKDPNILERVSIFPNPASEFIYISSSIKIDKIKMFNVIGKQVISSDEVEKLKVSHLQSGIYFMKVFAENASVTKKIVIE